MAARINRLAVYSVDIIIYVLHPACNAAIVNLVAWTWIFAPSVLYFADPKERRRSCGREADRAAADLDRHAPAGRPEGGHRAAQGAGVVRHGGYIIVNYIFFFVFII